MQAKASALPLGSRIVKPSQREAFAALLGMVLLLGACEREPGAGTPAPAPQAAPASTRADTATLTPRQTVKEIRRLRHRAAFVEMADHLVPEQREATVDYLLAVDRVVASHTRLSRTLSERVGAGAAASIRPGPLANIAGVFSADVEIVDVAESENGDDAVVTYCVNGQVPLETVTLVRGDDRWLLRPAPIDPEVTVQLRKLAEAADKVRVLVQSRNMTTEQVHQELGLRQTPILTRIAELTTEPDD